MTGMRSTTCLGVGARRSDELAGKQDSRQHRGCNEPDGPGRSNPSGQPGALRRTRRHPLSARAALRCALSSRRRNSGTRRSPPAGPKSMPCGQPPAASGPPGASRPADSDPQIHTRHDDFAKHTPETAHSRTSANRPFSLSRSIPYVTPSVAATAGLLHRPTIGGGHRSGSMESGSRAGSRAVPMHERRQP